MTAPLDGAPVLVVEDDERLRALLTEELTDAGFEVQGAASAEEALATLRSFGPELILSDLRLPGVDGMALLEQVVGLHAAPAFLVLTAFGTVPQAVAALRSGADDFLTKPVDLDHLLISVRRALQNRRLQHEVRRFRQLLDQDTFHGLVGRSRAMRKVYHQVERVAGRDGAVLLVGETGTGKDLVARAIHAESPRARRPFLAVNAAGVPENLLESEFFGHAAGAFTGAAKERRGLFAEADGGTLFLDEISEMPLTLQAKLLRTLQDGRIRPVGSDRESVVDVRVIAASNRDLGEEVEAGRFRQDLYFRLETFTIQLPPLRERGDDLQLLIGHFLRLQHQGDGPPPALTPTALALLEQWRFPGNIRELQNVLEWAVTFADGRSITEDDLPERIRGEPAPPPAEGDLLATLRGDGLLPTLAEVEARYVRYVLDQVDGNKRRAAALLGIGRRTLYRRLDAQED